MVLGADDDVGRWVTARTGGEWYPGMGRAIGFARGKMLVGGVTFFGYNGTNVWTGVASDDPRWLSRSNLAKIFDYSFRQLKVQRLTALVDASNTRSRLFVEYLGFSREATLEASAPDGGDQIAYVMRAEDCRWLHDLRYFARERRDGRRQAAAGSQLPGPRPAAGATQH